MDHVWSRAALITAGLYAMQISCGNAVVAKRYLNLGYTSDQAEAEMENRLGQSLPYYYDRFVFTAGKPVRHAIYWLSEK